MRKLRILKSILVRTHAADMLIGYMIFIFSAALVSHIAEP